MNMNIVIPGLFIGGTFVFLILWLITSHLEWKHHQEDQRLIQEHFSKVAKGKATLQDAQDFISIMKLRGRLE